MASFYKLVLGGTAFGQRVNNIFYYQRNATNDAPFDPAAMGDLATVFDTDVVPALGSAVVAGLDWTDITVTTINELQETTSPYAITVAPTSNGGVPEGPDTTGICWIVGFRVIPSEAAPLVRAPKRSYIALGPAPSSQIEPNGATTLPLATRENVEAAVSQVLEGGVGAYTPMRVGRADSLPQARYGRVIDGLFRPFASFRRSRLFKPTGA